MTTFTLSEKKQNLYSDYCQFLLASFTNFTQNRTTTPSHGCVTKQGNMMKQRPLY